MNLLVPIAEAAPATLGEFADLVVGLVNSIVPVLITLAFVLFLWGAAQSILKADDANARKDGRKKMVYAGISLFVIVSLWGILELALVSLLGGGGGGPSPHR